MDEGGNGSEVLDWSTPLLDSGWRPSWSGALGSRRATVDSRSSDQEKEVTSVSAYENYAGLSVFGL